MTTPALVATPQQTIAGVGASEIPIALATGAAPTITSGNAITQAVGATVNFALTATGSPTMDWTAANLPVGLTLNTVTNTIQGSVPAGSTNTFTVTANNGVTPPATQTITIVADGTLTGTAPTITSGWTVLVASGATPTYTATATGTAPIVFSIAPSVAGWSINPSTGVVTGPLFSANQAITIVATNGTAPPASKTVNFALNTAPQLVISNLPSSVPTGSGQGIVVTENGVAVEGVQIFVGGVSKGFTNVFGTLYVVMPAPATNVLVEAIKTGFSPANQTIQITGTVVTPQLVMSGLPSTVVSGQSYPITVSSGGSPVAGASVSINGVLVGTTNASGVLNATMPAASNNVPVVVSASGYASATQTITITAATVAPVFTSGNTADAQGNYTATASGSPAPTFGISPPVVGWSINSVTGVVTHPVLTANITVQIQATNSAGTASQSVSFAAQTVAPVFTSGSTSNSASQYTATATGTAPIVFSIAPAVAGWSIDPSTGVVTHPVISANQTITIVASNGTAPNASLAVSFVSNAPLQLVMSGLPSTTIPGQSYFVAATSNGVPVSAVDVSIAGVSFGVTDAFGYLTVVMPAAANNVLVVASRSGYVSANQVISIVAPTIAPTITSPVSALPVVSGSAPVYTATATGTLPIVWSLIGAPIGWSINASTGVITAPIITATQAIIVQASNGTSPNAMQAVVFAVNAVTPPPKVCINDPDTAIASAKTGKICLVYWPFRFPKRDK